MGYRSLNNPLSLLLNLCKNCTGCTLGQFATIIHIANMTAYRGSITLKKSGELRLRQPHSITIQTDIQLGLSVRGLIYDYLTFVHSVPMYNLISNYPKIV